MDNQQIPSEIEMLGTPLHVYGLIIGIATVVVLLNVDKALDKELKWYDFSLIIFAALFGARFLFVLHNFDQFLANPSFLYQTFMGGLALYGAVVGGFLALLAISVYRKMKLSVLTDAFALYLPLGQAIGRFGNYVNQELYGKPTELPWGIYIDPENRLDGYEKFEYFHPTFLYESILNILSYLILMKMKVKHKIGTGVISGMYLVNYGLIRLLMNRFRIDKEYFWGIETSDLLSIIAISSGIALIIYLNKKSTRPKPST